MSSSWNNWSDTIQFTVLDLADPITLGELKAAVAAAAANGRKVRVVGSGHSWSLGAVPGTAPYTGPGQQTDANLIDISGMNPTNTDQDSYLKAIYFQDGDGTNLVAVPPGTTQGWLATNAANASNDFIVPAPYRGYDPDHLYSNAHADLALESAGPAPDITLGGFIANGCHGTGWEHPTVADLVQAIEVVVWDAGQATTRSYAVSDTVRAACVDNQVFESAPTVDPQAISAMRCSLGALGAISKMVLKAIPSFNVAHINEYVDNDTLWQADFLEQLVTSTDYTEIFWFPYNDQCWVMRYSEARPPNTEPAHTGQLGLFVEINSVLANLTGDKLGKLFEEVPWVTPATLQGLWAVMKKFPGMRQLESADFWTDFDAGDTQVVAPLWQAYLYQLQYFTDLLDVSYTVPVTAKPGGGYDFSKVITAWNEALAEVETMRSNRKYPLNLNLHVRFIKNSAAQLSPAVWPDSSTHTCYIEFLSFSETEEVYQGYADAVGQQWNNLGGLPHWAKAFQFVSNGYSASHAKLSARGSLTAFNAQIAADDPTGLFHNDFLAQLLDGQASSEAVAAAEAVSPAPVYPAKRFRFDSADAWTAVESRLSGDGGVTREGAGTLFLESAGKGGLLDEHKQVHPLTVSFDPETNRATFTLLSKSKFLSAKELFAVIGVLLRTE